ncbi:hypothetical protein [Candidatus Pantoea bituminis]|uniref:hypothetical protein n=1 Tax=Candidatus Pantoea bituminis TaxID=2831036 RepID=UPI001C064293|nr:hypothetical protein [Pantoea bituminis]
MLEVTLPDQAKPKACYEAITVEQIFQIVLFGKFLLAAQIAFFFAALRVGIKMHFSQ